MRYLLAAVMVAMLCTSIIIGGAVLREGTLGTRKVLCIGILHNETNTARTDPLVLRLCEEVGVRP